MSSKDTYNVQSTIAWEKFKLLKSQNILQLNEHTYSCQAWRAKRLRLRIMRSAEGAYHAVREKTALLFAQNEIIKNQIFFKHVDT